ncbi:hypothetical protein J6590_033484 [Homalodisca vitripennis]|nr:hypothetical protein J6590_033484 [Homalodisca vitripennis]
MIHKQLINRQRDANRGRTPGPLWLTADPATAHRTTVPYQSDRGYLSFICTISETTKQAVVENKGGLRVPHVRRSRQTTTWKAVIGRAVDTGTETIANDRFTRHRVTGRSHTSRHLRTAESETDMATCPLILGGATHHATFVQQNLRQTWPHVH